jgi:hypothetical protein
MAAKAAKTQGEIEAAICEGISRFEQVWGVVPSKSTP